ncbi:MAG: efflux RND transporter permease subunit, partial [Pseudomonadota bacterium]
MSARLARRRPLDIWPGFVDALAALLMVVIFVLLLFTLGQYFLTDELSGKQRALSALEGQVAELTDMLALEQSTSATLTQRLATLSESLAAAQAARSTLTDELAQSEASLAASTETVAALNADLAALTELRDALQAEVAELAGTLDTTRREATVQAELTDEARLYGLSTNDLASQIRNGFFGVEAAQIQRGRDDVRVLVRLPSQERNSLYDLLDTRIATSSGTLVALSAVAQITESLGPTEILRRNGRTITTITADVDSAIVTSSEANGFIRAEIL